MLIYKMSYDLKGHGRSHKAGLLLKFFLIFIYQPLLITISVVTHIMKTQIFLKIKYDLKRHMRSLLCYYWLREFLRSNYYLDLPTYVQFLSLFYNVFDIF